MRSQTTPQKSYMIVCCVCLVPGLMSMFCLILFVCCLGAQRSVAFELGRPNYPFCQPTFHQLVGWTSSRFRWLGPCPRICPTEVWKCEISFTYVKLGEHTSCKGVLEDAHLPRRTSIRCIQFFKFCSGKLW